MGVVIKWFGSKFYFSTSCDASPRKYQTAELQKQWILIWIPWSSNLSFVKACYLRRHRSYVSCHKTFEIFLSAARQRCAPSLDFPKYSPRPWWLGAKLLSSSDPHPDTLLCIIYIYILHTHAHTHTHIYIYIIVHIYIHIFKTHTHTYIYIYVCVYIYIYMYIYICIYTYILTFCLAVFLALYSDILFFLAYVCGISSDSLSGILSGISSEILWLRSGSERSDPELAIEVRRGILWSGARGWGPAGNTLIYFDHVWPVACSWGPAGIAWIQRYPEVAVRVRRTLRSRACSWGQAQITLILGLLFWRRTLRSSACSWDLALRSTSCNWGPGEEKKEKEAGQLT